MSSELRDLLARVPGVELRPGTSARFTIKGFAGSAQPRIRDGVVLFVTLTVGAIDDGPWISRWVAETNNVLDGVRVDSSSRDGGATFTVRVTLPSDTPSLAALRKALRLAVETAHRVQWVLEHAPEPGELGAMFTGFEEMVLTLAKHRLPAPPVPVRLRPWIVRLADWCWATYDVDSMDLYMGVGPAKLKPDRFACAQVGHGLNSYFLALVVVIDGNYLGGRVPYGSMIFDTTPERHAVARQWASWQEALDRLEGWQPDTLEAAVERARAKAAKRARVR